MIRSCTLRQELELTEIKFLVDESYDFIFVRILRSDGYDGLSVAESFPSVSDHQVIQQPINTLDLG